MSDLWPLLGALAPVFALMALGLGLRRLGIFTELGIGELNRFVYWVALPVQLLVVVAGADVVHQFDARALLASIAAFALGMGGGWVATSRLPAEARGCVLTGMTRSNAAFIGLPVIGLVARTMSASEGQALLSSFSVLVGSMVACFNIGAVLAFTLPHHGLNRQGLLRAVAELPRNPLIIGCVLGVILSLVKPGLLAGTPPGRTIEILAGSAIPLALLLTGAQLDFHHMRANTGLLLAVSLGKLVLVPALTWGLGWCLGVDHLALAAATILMACPVAMASTPMARILGGDAELMAAIIVATTVCSPLTLLGWLLFLR